MRSPGGTRISELVDRYGERDKDGARGRTHRHRHERPDPGHPIVREGQLSRAVRRPGEDPGLRPPGRAAGARLPDLQAARFRRLGRRRRAPVPHQDQRAHDLGVAPALPRQVPAAAAREVARSDRRRDPLPPALPRSDRQPRLAAGVRDAEPDHRGDPRVHVRARLSRGRDADDAADRRRRARPAVHDASQHARHGSLPSHRARAVPQAADRRRPGEGVRDQPELPERGDFDAAQSRIHDDGVLRGLFGLPGADDPDRGAVGDGGDAGRRHRRGHLRRASDFVEGAVRAAVPARGGARGRGGQTRPRRRRRASCGIATPPPPGAAAGPRGAVRARRREDRDRRSSRRCARTS